VRSDGKVPNAYLGEPKADDLTDLAEERSFGENREAAPVQLSLYVVEMVEKFVSECTETAVDAASSEKCALRECERLTEEEADPLLYGAKLLPRCRTSDGVLDVPQPRLAKLDELMEATRHARMKHVIDLAQTRRRFLDGGELSGKVSHSNGEHRISGHCGSLVRAFLSVR
jgi:hypothetical protein